MARLRDPLSTLKGVGPKVGEAFARLGLSTLEDALFHLPLRYEDRTRITPLAAVRPGQAVVFEATVRAAQVTFGRRRSLVIKVQDGSGLATLRLFHFSKAQQQQLQPGRPLRGFGEGRGGAGGIEFVHPELTFLDSGAAPALDDRLTPIYPTTEGLGQARLRSLLQRALALLESAGAEALGLTETLLADLRHLHTPPVGTDLATLEAGLDPAQQRLAFDELLAHQLAMMTARSVLQAQPAPRLTGDPTLEARFLSALPFELTRAQRRVNAELAADLDRAQPMLRLLQGDVGSGKTVVAALALLRAVGSGFQGALMAPTELLAEQHLKTLAPWLEALGLRCAALTGRLGAKQRRALEADLASGAIPVVVGTHALFQESVAFQRLGLVVIDEQHRFGVDQRLALRDKGASSDGVPHQLVMTATPIPRTLAMSAYADLDVSVIDSRPPGRTPVTTVVLPASRREALLNRVREACKAGRQAYWVCTLIERSEHLEAEAAEETAETLAKALPELTVGLVHGRLKGDAKAAAMRAFAAGDTQLLVATTVIEVGVDVPNASLMIIENAERLGLAQLHQLRGRVGRGAAASHCVLLYQSPLGRHGKARLEALRTSDDGFYLAEKDLTLRGPGEVLGTRQTGALDLKVADLLRDQDQLPAIQEAARALLASDPAAAAPIMQRWLGTRQQFINA